MFIITKRAFLFFNGDEKCALPNEFIGDIPAGKEWIQNTPLYKNAVADKSIIESGKGDKEIDNALNTKTKAVEKQEAEEKTELKEEKKKAK